MTPQFRNTAVRLIRDVSLGLGRDYKDADWVGRFCLAFVGNLAHECGGFNLMEEGKPTVKGSLGGVSFPQWTGMRSTQPFGRRFMFMAFCREKRLHPYSYDAAIGFILHELLTTAKGVVMATYNAAPLKLDAVPNANPALLGRVVRFEKLYENAGVKHYPSRYRYAIMAMDAYKEWVASGFAEPGKYVMPKARFSVAFDKEFGTGESTTTTRWDRTERSTFVAKPAPPADWQGVLSPGANDRVLPDGRVEAGGKIQPAPAVAPQWPEDLLSPEEIKAIQQRFRDLGYVRVGLVNGRWTQAVTNAVLALQAEHGLATNGHYTPEVRQALADGLTHAVDEARATATEKALTKAGEPTLTAVHPASLVAKIGTWLGSAGTFVVGTASFFPQASTMIDGAKAYITDVPPYVWTIALALAAAYLWYTTHQVKKVAVDNFRTGANTALDKPIANDNATAGAPVIPAVPGVSFAPERKSDQQFGNGVARLDFGLGDPEPEPEPDEHPDEIEESDEDRPLATEAA